MVAKKARKKKSGLSLGFLITSLLGVLLLLTLGGAAAVTWFDGERRAREAVESVLNGTQTAYSTLQNQRYRQLGLMSRLLKSDPILISYLANAARGGDPEGISDALEEYEGLLSFDLAIILDRDGSILYRSDNDDMTADLAVSPLVASAFELDEAFGVWRHGDRLYHAMAVGLAQNFDLVGCVIVGLAIDDNLALQLLRSAGADVAIMARSRTLSVVAASQTLNDLREDLERELRSQGRLLERVMPAGNDASAGEGGADPASGGRGARGGEAVDGVELTLRGEAWSASLLPLQDAEGTAIGSIVALASRARYVADTYRTLMVLGGLGALALLVGLTSATLLSRRALAPVGALAAAAEQAAGGDPQVSVPVSGSGDVGRLGSALASLLGGLREKMALENVVGRVSRFLPEPAKSRPASGPRSLDAALVAVEMQRFASPKISYDPEENLGRFSRDLKRIEAVAETHQGRVESVYGHRVLTVFEGEGYALRALTAATEILVALSERESVFDEPTPPVVAATHGSVITGSVAGGDEATTTVAGLAVQQLESLMREATAGEIHLSKPLTVELLQVIRGAGVEPRGQKGFLSPQPFYVLTAEMAGKVTGVSTEPSASAGFPDERRSLSDLEVGTALGHRFDLLAELGTGRMGTVFKAQDRELGDVVTLKMLKPEVVADPNQFQWLRGVIQLARMIRHPNVLALFDFGETDGLPYVSTEFARGVTLRYVFAQGRQLPYLAVQRLARELSQGLTAIHAERVLHRGVKPENVLVEPNGRARWMDVGLTVPVSAGGTLGSFGYMSPEELGGQPASDPRGDIYSLGVVLYEALAGQLPVAGASVDELRHRHTTEEPAPLSTLCELPGELERIVLRCLAKSPEQRYGSAGEILEALDSLSN